MKREEIIAAVRDDPRFEYRGVKFADALLYHLLIGLLPQGDPGL
jgi:hypothetical protein